MAAIADARFLALPVAKRLPKLCGKGVVAKVTLWIAKRLSPCPNLSQTSLP